MTLAMNTRSFIAALPVAFLSRSTLVPFLYQTRTITSLCGKKQIPQYRHVNVAGRKNFDRCAFRSFSHEQGSGISVVADESTQDPEMDTRTEEGRFTIRRVVGGSYSNPEKFSYLYRPTNGPTYFEDDGEYAEWRADDLSGIGFKVQASNDKGLDGQPRELGIPWGEGENVESEEPDIENADEVVDLYQEADEIENLTRKPDPSQGRTSTITPSERLAFQKIFSDIFARSQPLTPHGMDGLLEEEELQYLDDIKKRADKARASVDSIINLAAQSLPREEIEAAVNRYPPALRPAAARAMRLTSNYSTVSKVRGNAAAIDAEQLRKPERERVEGLMRSATTDLELWSIMQKEVFPLISKLGLEEAPEQEAPSKKKSAEASHDLKDPPQDGPQQTRVSLDSPVKEMSPLEFYGPLYPAYLLLGLRLLDRSFARSSPLTLAILPAIKSLGIISHVLGGSMQLYNELLLIHWYQHDDFKGVLRLLMEMERFGVSWDQETWDIIDYVARLQTVVERGERGIALKSLWSLPEFAPGQFKRWRNKIAQDLEKKESRDAHRLRY